MKAAFLLGRVLFGGFFLYNGINHFKQRKQLAQYAGSKGVPMPEAAVLASGVQLTAGGASLILGLEPRLGAVLIAAFLLTVSPMMHDYWNVSDAPEHQEKKMSEMIKFSKNMAMVGAVAALAGHPEPWPLSVQSLIGNKRESKAFIAGSKPSRRRARLLQMKRAA